MWEKRGIVGLAPGAGQHPPGGLDQGFSHHRVIMPREVHQDRVHLDRGKTGNVDRGHSRRLDIWFHTLTLPRCTQVCLAPDYDCLTSMVTVKV